MKQSLLYIHIFFKHVRDSFLKFCIHLCTGNLVKLRKVLIPTSNQEVENNSTTNRGLENKRGIYQIYASLIYQLPLFSDRLLTQFDRKLWTLLIEKSTADTWPTSLQKSSYFLKLAIAKLEKYIKKTRAWSVFGIICQIFGWKRQTQIFAFWMCD